MTEFKNQMFEDDDLRDVIAEIEKLDDEAEKIMATARGKVSGLRGKQKAARKRAKDDLNIPNGVLSPILRSRKLDRQLQKLREGVAEDLVEIYEDARGQFALFPDGAVAAKPAPAEKPWPDDKPARTKADDDAEQAAGAAQLEAVH